jgi:hypothetical protein
MKNLQDHSASADDMSQESGPDFHQHMEMNSQYSGDCHRGRETQVSGGLNMPLFNKNQFV